MRLVLHMLAGIHSVKTSPPLPANYGRMANPVINR